MLVRGAIAVVLVILLGYGVMEAWPLLSGPSLTLSSLTGSGVGSDGIVTIAGTAKRVVALTLDGAPLLTDENGTFSTVIVLPHGGAILTLTAADRFGRTVTRQEPVYVPD